MSWTDRWSRSAGSALPICPTPDPPQSLLPLWIALRSNVREILEGVSLADVASAELPAGVSALTDAPGAWTNP
ncbi:hypothetical protein QFZ24_009280 [Streptomyces phaeochromogenes]|nr:hypothetical protein [Streptomyces phaeochromogenes]